MTISSKVLAAVATLAIGVFPAWSQDVLLRTQAVGSDVGDLTDVAAWVNTMSISGSHTLIIVGEITAPTPCHTATTQFAGLEKSNPPVYLVDVDLVPPPEGTICLEVLTDIEFRYEQPNYAETAEEAKVSSDQTSVVVPITTAS